MNGITRLCKDCQIEKPLEMFRFSNNNHRLDCKTCENQKRVERRKKKLSEDPDYREKLREYDTERKRLSRKSN